MLYQLYQPYEDVGDTWRCAAESMGALLSRLPNTLSSTLPVRSARAACEVVAGAKLTHERPPFGIDKVRVGDQELAVTEEVVLREPFGSLLHFAKERDLHQPKVLLVAPLSGHFATLLRNTARTMLRDHDVFITDWHNARDVPLADGPFGFEHYVASIIRFVEHLGEGCHLLAVCQPCVPALVAASVMAQRHSEVQPPTLTLMAGPVDTRINPTKVNELATSKPIEWFERNLISEVPRRFAGAGRRVYPGFLQISAFMSMNVDRHVRSHVELYGSLVRGDQARAQFTKDFYDEYLAVLDLPAEFYLETVQRVFQRYELARGVMTFEGQRVEPQAMRRTTLMTVEGERDDICSVGQTLAAHDLCAAVPPYRRQHHLQAGVGHYGVFSGSRWEREIYPRVRSFIMSFD